MGYKWVNVIDIMGERQVFQTWCWYYLDASALHGRQINLPLVGSIKEISDGLRESLILPSLAFVKSTFEWTLSPFKCLDVSFHYLWQKETLAFKQ